MPKKVAWVLGGAKGLGVMVAKGLAQDGYQLVINYRKSRQAAQKLQHELQEIGSDALILQGDVSQLSAVKQMVQEVMHTWGRIDVLVCTAGPFHFKPIPLVELQDHQWGEMIDGNLSSVFYITREVIPIMRQQGGGRIITFGFAGAELAPAWSGYSSYAAAKVGLVSLTRTLAEEEASFGITVNMIYPGDIRDPYKEALISEARGQADPRSRVGRPGTGEDIARVVRFLAHPDSDWITGAIIPVTGGFSLHWNYVK
ncbi:SDR family oxidoreductase [Thermoflavimicrobium daqui]|uniref:3-oxoacyl-ACP reductase n=1 Tax=Thermoflavimicrobium daqui TaxID=2137476 RepID=A0A364K1K7_9BACL|nr:SDR family oxidoreductase [Thermoflavimicrobium daqui]RAL21495.1 3-oxoacyl-ACP reductase [Thermoflavimicrobium daqui]